VSPRRLAIALALAATTLTATAAADAPDAPVLVQGSTAPATAASSSGSTPLSLRPSKAIELAPEPAHGALAWKVAFVLALVGGAALYLRRRATPIEARMPELTIVRRAAVGLRSELVVVNVEGQRLLIGVTPHTIQSLAILDADEPHAQLAAAPPRGASNLGERFAAMLDTASRTAPAPDLPVAADPPRRARAERPSPRALQEDEVAEQARGLAALRRAG
jgi:flagellar biogenesis protein FliO